MVKTINLIFATLAEVYLCKIMHNWAMVTHCLVYDIFTFVYNSDWKKCINAL